MVVTTASQAVQILRMRWNGGRSSNGISKLYAQLLGAKLNIANGADGSAAAGAIAAADLILAAYDQAAWTSLSRTDRSTILKLAKVLDAYNNGRIGPGHCDISSKGSKGSKGYKGSKSEDDDEDEDEKKKKKGKWRWKSKSS